MIAKKSPSSAVKSGWGGFCYLLLFSSAILPSSRITSFSTYAGGFLMPASQFSIVLLGISKTSLILCWVSPALSLASLIVVNLINPFQVAIYPNDLACLISAEVPTNLEHALGASVTTNRGGVELVLERSEYDCFIAFLILSYSGKFSLVTVKKISIP